MSSTAPPSHRHPGRRQVRCASLARSLEPTKPYFQSSLRPAADDEIRAGSGRRGGSTGEHAPPGQVPAVGDRAPAATWAATVRAGASRRARRWCAARSTSAPSARCTSAMSPAGRRPVLERRRPAAAAGWAAPGCRPWPQQVVDERAVGRRRASPATRRTARACRPVTTTGRPRRRQARRLQRPVQRPRPSGDVPRLAEPLLPDLRPRTRRAAASGRGTPRWPCAPPSELGQHRPVAVGADQRAARRAVAARRLVGAAGQPVTHVGGHDQRRAGAGSAARSAPTPERTAPPKS